MPNRIRDLLTEPLTMEYLKQRTDQGWVAAAVEWIRAPLPEQSVESETLRFQEVPYGQKVSGDCRHLTDDPVEMNVLLLIYEKVVAGWRPPRIALELNNRGHRTRGGAQWTPAAVFDLMPRIVELSPKFQERPDWPSRRAALQITA
jgi:Recombinase